MTAPRGRQRRTAIRLRALTGPALEPALDDLARLRIAVFREFPYLYDGDVAYEADYLRTYAETPGAVLVAAFDGDRVVGASTGLPLAGEQATLRAPFEHAGWPVDAVFYFGESVLLPEYRGRGIGVRFFQAREAHARALGGIDWCVFCAVVRSDDHPRRPAGHVPLDAFWARRGYARLDGLTASLAWKDLDETSQSDKPMQFWGRRIV